MSKPLVVTSTRTVERTVERAPTEHEYEHEHEHEPVAPPAKQEKKRARAASKTKVIEPAAPDAGIADDRVLTPEPDDDSDRVIKPELE